jgi:hypothetical protein
LLQQSHFGENLMLDAHQLLWTQIAAGVCLLIFASLLFNLFRMRSRMQSARSWGKVEGVITVSKVDQPREHTSDDLNDATPVIRYRYRVGGQDLEGDQVAIGGQPLTTRVLAGRLIARYPVGAHVDVHVDPNNPKNAVLEPGRAGNISALIVFAATFGFAGAILATHAIAGHVLYTRNGVPLFAFALPAVALLGAVLSVAAFVRGRRLASASARWPTAAGIVTTSGVIEEQFEDKRDDDKSVMRKKISRYQVDLRYAYRVGKRDFVGTAAGWGWTGIFGLRELAEKAAACYPQGQPVTVYYDPEQPGNAVLDPSNRQGSLAPLILAAIFTVVGGIILMFFVKVGFN